MYGNIINNIFLDRNYYVSNVFISIIYIVITSFLLLNYLDHFCFNNSQYLWFYVKFVISLYFSYKAQIQLHLSSKWSPMMSTSAWNWTHIVLLGDSEVVHGLLSTKSSTTRPAKTLHVHHWLIQAKSYSARLLTKNRSWKSCFRLKWRYWGSVPTRMSYVMSTFVWLNEMYTFLLSTATVATWNSISKRKRSWEKTRQWNF
jgi:hypothetical protein